MDISKLRVFAENTKSNQKATWKDKQGSLIFSIHNHGIQNFLDNNPDTLFFVSDFLREKVSVPTANEKKNPKAIGSIGVFSTHNEAKLTYPDLYKVAIPAPLSNDGFCTNRCQHPGKKGSVQGVYPKEIVIDKQLLGDLPYQSSLLGFGEITGLYYSIIDYYIARDLPVHQALIDLVVQMIKTITRNYYMKKQDKVIESIALGLMLKCLIMRSNQNHEIGCSGDHLIANHLEKTHNYLHGEAVSYGAILMAHLHPDWSAYGLREEDIIRWSLDFGLIPDGTQKLFSKKSEIISNAIYTRPNRKTTLKGVIDA